MNQLTAWPVVTLVVLGLSLVWALFLRAGIYPSDWVSTILFTGGIALLYWMFVRKRNLAPQLPWWLRCVIWALPCYCAFQLLPLPLGLLQVLSPARAQLAAALAPILPGVSSAPISVNPPMALFWGFSLLCYVAVFFLLRELGWRFADQPFAVFLPLLAAGAAEAALGLLQFLTRGPNAEATGTYTNRDHFSGMLEMILPLAVMYGWTILQRSRNSFEHSLGPAFQVCLLWGAAALILVAIVLSASRMGLFVALCTLFVLAALSFGPHLPSENIRTASLTLIAVASLALFIFLPPDQLLARFAEMSASGKMSTDTLLNLWNETLSLIGEFRWFGCGLGGFSSTFLKYQGAAGEYRVEMAHNDYLQYLAELGLVGFSILLAAATGVCLSLVKGIVQITEEPRRHLLVACAGSFVAIALHSVVDFNLYIPANAMILAWIAGAASINGLD
jgi:O-antigen ligase